MKTFNSAIFVNIFDCLIKYKTNKNYPLSDNDWYFDKDVIKFIKDTQDNCDFVIVVNNVNKGNLYNPAMTNRIINKVAHLLSSILNINVTIMDFDCNDEFLNYPSPGCFYNIAIDNDINLSNSYHISNDLFSEEINYVGIFVNSNVL